MPIYRPTLRTDRDAKEGRPWPRGGGQLGAWAGGQGRRGLAGGLGWRAGLAAEPRRHAYPLKIVRPPKDR